MIQYRHTFMQGVGLDYWDLLGSLRTVGTVRVGSCLSAGNATSGDSASLTLLRDIV